MHLVGTFSNVLNVVGSGSAGNPVTFLFEPGAKFSASLWPASGAINITGKNWIVIDGGSNGLIENTNNGTSLGNQAQSFGVLGAQSSNLTVQNLTITNMYHRTDISDWNRMGECIDITDGSYILVQNCHLSDGDTLLSYTYGSGSHSDVTFNANTILRGNHTINIGTAQVNAFLSNLTISSNRIDHLDAWDSVLYLGSPLHLDGMILFNEAKIAGTNVESGWVSNALIYANSVGPFIGKNNTAAMFFDVYYASTFVGVKIFNNLFTTTNYWMNGFVNLSGTACLIANNTFIGYPQPSGNPADGGTGTAIKVGDGVHVYNNMFDLTGTEINMAGWSGKDFDCDYNLYNRFYNGGTGAFVKTTGTQLGVTDWFPYIAPLDTHSTWPFPFRTVLDANYMPRAGIGNGVGAGMNLTSYGITNDLNGNPRPATGPWTIGAFETSSSSSSMSPPTVHAPIKFTP